MPEYRFVRLFLTIGPACAAICVLVLAGVGIWAVVQGLIGWIGAALLALTGVICGFLVMVLVDLTRLIADMLLPR
jgi:hypothetical protein